MKNILRMTLKGLGLVVVLLPAVVLVRLGWATVRVAQAEVSDVALTEIGSTQSLTILPLYEEAAVDDSYEQGHGVAYLLTTDTATILLDLGDNPQQTEPAPLEANMAQAGVTAADIDLIVNSHNHPDHTGGLGAVGLEAWGETAVLAAQPLTVASSEARVAEVPQIIAPGMASLGGMPFVQAFPFWLWQPLGWEQALVVNIAGEGLVVITGCGHPTVEAIVTRAEALFGEPVVGIVGGLHYQGLSAAELTPHINFLATRPLQLVAPSPHDTDEPALAAFADAFPDAYQTVQVGELIHIGETAVADYSNH